MWQAAAMNPSKHSTSSILILSCLLSCLWSHDAAAWGNVGHRITGLIAERLLTPTARQQVQQLLGEESLAVAATDMDTQRTTLNTRWPAADRWHYDNQPVCNANAGYCADGNCATQQIARFRKVLADKSIDRTERALALRLLIHMLGDIHQPLHMADNLDRGGNQLYVRLYAGGERYRLHEVFDTVLIKQLMGEQRISRYADGLLQRYQAQLPAWQQGNLNSWSEQTHQLAVTRTYGELPNFKCGQHDQTLTLSNIYVASAKQYIPEQLTKAGIRIAAVLNAILQ